MAFTYFFRDLQTLELIIKHFLPSVTGNKYINIWDAGCTHGPEPYSIAIILRENMSHFLFRNVRIYATDIDTSNLFGNIINKGIYSEVEIKRIPKEIKQKYFQKVYNNEYKISDEIMSYVFFSQHDLLTLKPIRADINLIVCKNVLLHFNHKQRIDVITMFHSVLVDNGFFVTEQTQKLPQEVESLFEQISNNGKVYKKIKI